jgi:hypothetical protein
VIISTSKGSVEVSLERERVRVTAPLTRNLNEVLDNVVEVPQPKVLTLKYGNVSVSQFIDSPSDIAYLFSDFIVKSLGLLEVWGEEGIETLYLPDSRAGVIRLTLYSYLRGESYPRSSPIGDILDRAFMHYLLRFARRLSSGYVLPRAIEEFLNELLCSDECLEVMRVGDIRTPIIYVKTKTGRKVPLHQAPSDIRESIVLVLSLTTSGIGVPNIIFIEEPEAHLHPRAITKLARLIGLGVNNGKKVIISTHSDYLLESINNLISLSKIKEEARKYGFNESEVIDPGSVAAYLVKFEGGKSVVKELEVTDKGILEEEFSEVTKELADQRAWIYYESS